MPPRSNPEHSSQRLIQPQNTYQRAAASISGLFKWFWLPILMVGIIVALMRHQKTTDGDEHPATSVTANGIPQLLETPHHDSLNPASMQAEVRNPSLDIDKLATVPWATQFQSAQDFSISGHPSFTNIGVNNVNYNSGTHGLENLKEFVSFAALHDSAEQDPDRSCHPGTRKYVLTQLRDWFDNPNTTNRIIWLHGPVGAGKSAIAQTIAHEYKDRGLAATFFFYRSDPSRNDGNRLFPTIAWQLAVSIPPTKNFIVHALDKTPHLPTQAVEPQFERLVALPFHPTNNIVSQMSHPAPVVIIDGVDECSEEKLQRRFLTVIGNAVKVRSVPLRFLIVSRPEALIEETFNKFEDFTVSIDLAILDDSKSDIQKYLEDKFSEIASNRDLDPTWPGQEIIQEIVFQSSGYFILPSTLIRFIGDEEDNPASQLDIVRKLKPHEDTSPFAVLDELYFEILKRPRNQNILKTFLALLIGRSSIERDSTLLIRMGHYALHEDDAMLMNISEKDLPVRLRKMRSLLKLEPFIDVYHKSFLDFLQDPSRSGQYHVSKQSGLKRYLELVVHSVVRHVFMEIEQSNHHEICHFSPAFKSIFEYYPVAVPAEYWQEALKPLLDLQDDLFDTLKPKTCRVTQVTRDLLLHLLLLQGKPHITTTHVPESNVNKTVTDSISSPIIEVTQYTPEIDLDSRLSALLSYLENTNSKIIVDGAIIDHMSSLLEFDYAETVARLRSISDAQKLIDLIDLLASNGSFLSPNTAPKAVHLASAVCARVPVLPRSLFLNRPAPHFEDLMFPVGTICRTVLISNILDHNHILPVLGIYDGQAQLQVGFGNVNEQTEPINEWLKRSRPNFSTRIRVMLAIARSIRYIHSMDIALHSCNIESGRFLFLDSNLRAKFHLFTGIFARWSDGHENNHFSPCGYTYEDNISTFGTLFHEICFLDHEENASKRLVDDANQLTERCRAKDRKSRPTMEEVVKEMETWNLS